jgi:hypothetical protein
MVHLADTLIVSAKHEQGIKCDVDLDTFAETSAQLKNNLSNCFFCTQVMENVLSSLVSHFLKTKMYDVAIRNQVYDFKFWCSNFFS